VIWEIVCEIGANGGDATRNVSNQRIAFPQKRTGTLRSFKNISTSKHFRFRVLRGDCEMCVRVIHDNCSFVW
jgi:hypothetical protein